MWIFMENWKIIYSRFPFSISWPCDFGLAIWVVSLNMSTFRLDRLLLRKPMDPTCARSLFVGKQLIQVTFTVLLKLGLPDFVVTIFVHPFSHSLWPNLKRWEMVKYSIIFLCNPFSWSVIFWYHFLAGGAGCKSNRGTYRWMEECNLDFDFGLSIRTMPGFFWVPPLSNSFFTNTLFHGRTEGQKMIKSISIFAWRSPL